MIIYARSPYFITVNESDQVGSKIELFLATNGGTVPSTANYVLSKSIASSTQLRNDYNISQFIREFFMISKPTENATTQSVSVQVKRYKETSPGSYTLLDTTNYLAVNGYTSGQLGINFNNSGNIFVCMSDPAVSITYKQGIASTDYPYVNIAVDFTVNGSSKLDAVYTDLNGNNSATVTYDTNSRTLLKIPARTTSTNYNAGNKLTLNWKPDGSTTSITTQFTVLPICEPKYTPVVCQFINRFGGWQFLTFFKAKSESLSVSGTTYNVLQETLSDIGTLPQMASFNINGKKAVRLNTGWVDESYSSIIQDLLLAETVLLDLVPVQIRTQSVDLKTSIKDKNINYEMEFEYAFNLINDAV